MTWQKKHRNFFKCVIEQILCSMKYTWKECATCHRTICEHYIQRIDNNLKEADNILQLNAGFAKC